MTNKYLKQIDSCIKEGWLSTISGGYMEEFEKEASKLFGNKYAVSTCNGTSSLYLSLFCLSLENNKKEIIIPAYGFHVSINIICSIGMKPVFCDVDPKTFAIDFDECEKLINKNTLAVMVLHPWGNIADLDKMSSLREKYDIFFVSDSSHAHESEWDNKPIGKYFDINCASFGLGKIISGGELGVLTTDNPIFRDRALLFAHTNRVPKDLIANDYKGISNNVGIKFRPHLFALLLALNDLKNNVGKRKKIRKNILKFQEEMLACNQNVFFQETYTKSKRSFHMPIIGLPSKVDRKKIIKQLNKLGFHAQLHNYRNSLSKDSILNDFYGIKIKKIYKNTENLIGKNIIQLRASDFTDWSKVKKLINLLNSNLGSCIESH